MFDPTLGHVTKKDLTGIGGWLILVAIGQVIGPIALLGQVARYMSTPEYSVAWKTLPLAMGGEFALNSAYFLFAIWCSINFFRKRTTFPALFIWELWLGVALPIADILLVALASSLSADELVDASSMREVIRAFVMAVIWTCYTLKSRRVRNTFVE
jgi:hypothetical protein